MNSDLLISIVVPNYNNQMYIGKCLESLINQTYKNLEIIVVDDGSVDDSVNVINNYLYDDRVRLIKKDNNGVSSARNIGIDNAIGDYITFVDSDDWIDKDSIETVVKYLITDNVDAVRYNYIKYDNKNRKEFGKMYKLSNRRIEKANFDLINSYLFSNHNNIPCYSPLLVIKNNLIVYFNENLKIMEDTVFYYDLLNNINNIYFLDKNLYHYRYCHNSASRKSDDIVIFNMLDSFFCLYNKNNYISNFFFSLVLWRIANYTNYSNYKLYKKNMIDLEKNSNFNLLIGSVNYSKLSFINKIKYNVIKRKCYFCLYLLDLIKEFLKKVLRK